MNKLQLAVVCVVLCGAAGCGQGAGDDPAAVSQTASALTWGAMWNFDGNNGFAPDDNNPMSLATIARYAASSGPCTYKPKSDPLPCHFDTRTIVPMGDGSRVESITAYGRIFNWDVSYTGSGYVYQASAKNGSELKSIDHYKGLCSYADAPKAFCKFDTRAIFVARDGKRTESITAYGRLFNFDMENDFAPAPDNGADLRVVPRYAEGPCSMQPEAPCTFDSRMQYIGSPGSHVESITAYGRMWDWDMDNLGPWPNNPIDLATVTRYANGPCYGVAAGSFTCVFDSRTMLDNWELITN